MHVTRYPHATDTANNLTSSYGQINHQKDALSSSGQTKDQSFKADTDKIFKAFVSYNPFSRSIFNPYMKIDFDSSEGYWHAERLRSESFN